VSTAPGHAQLIRIPGLPLARMRVMTLTAILETQSVLKKKKILVGTVRGLGFGKTYMRVLGPCVAIHHHLLGF